MRSVFLIPTSSDEFLFVALDMGGRSRRANLCLYGLSSVFGVVLLVCVLLFLTVAVFLKSVLRLLLVFIVDYRNFLTGGGGGLSLLGRGGFLCCGVKCVSRGFKIAAAERALPTSYRSGKTRVTLTLNAVLSLFLRLAVIIILLLVVIVVNLIFLLAV